MEKGQLGVRYCTKIRFMPCVDPFNAKKSYLIANAMYNNICPILTYSLLIISIKRKDACKKLDKYLSK